MLAVETGGRWGREAVEFIEELEAKYGNKWRGKALRKKTRGFYVRAWWYQGLMKRMPNRNAAKALQQQMYEHYSASSEADPVETNAVRTSCIVPNISCWLIK